jgi:hypothetical protein
MTASELIKALEKIPPNNKIMVFDLEYDVYLEVKDVAVQNDQIHDPLQLNSDETELRIYT